MFCQKRFEPAFALFVPQEKLAGAYRESRSFTERKEGDKKG